MKSELEEILSGFEKRMKFINIVRRFLDYSLPDDIKETFDNNREKLNNIIIFLSVIMDSRWVLQIYLNIPFLNVL